MRSLALSVLGAALLVGVGPSAALAQRARPGLSPSQPGPGMTQPRMFRFVPTMTGYSAVSRMSYGGYGMSGMSSGGSGMSGMSGMSSGGYGSSQGSSGDYGTYQTPYGGYAPSSPSGSTPATRAADEFEASKPLDSPPPWRALVRVRVPDARANVGFDGQKVDAQGLARTYVTPELSGTRTFEVTATWTINGRLTWVREEVTVRPGQIRTLDFTSGN